MPNTHTVQAGDTLSEIAQRYDTTVDRLLASNPEIQDPNLILVGQRIRTGDAGEQLASAELTHVVQQGDTLSGIAAHYGVSLDALLAANPQIGNPDLIYPEDHIEVPVSDQATPEQAGTYVVQAGDTLGEIAAAQGTSVAALAAANGIANPDLIYPGDVLVVPGPGRVPEAPGPAAPQAPEPAPGAFDYQQIAGVANNPNVTSAFIGEVEAMAGRLGTRPEYLMAVMSFETGETFSPAIQNPASSATGLIQFLDSTAEGLGTSTAELRTMTATEQLEYVERYFQQFDGGLDTLEGVYTAVLSGRPQPDADTALFTQGDGNYGPNAGLDFDRNGAITTGEATAAVAAKLYGGVDAVQQRLLDLGYADNAGFVDGQFGPNTSAALRAFQQDNGLPATGLLDDRSGQTLFAQGATPATPAPTGEVPEYDPYTVYSTGGGTVQITDPSQLRPHHDYQTQVRDGHTLEVRDVTIAHAGQAHDTQAVPAPISGEVIHAGPLGNAGNAVIVRGEDGIPAYLFHLSRVDVAVGDQIDYGESIGLQGSTGNSTGDHVHIEASPATIDQWVDDLLDGRFDGTRA